MTFLPKEHEYVEAYQTHCRPCLFNLVFKKKKGIKITDNHMKYS